MNLALLQSGSAFTVGSVSDRYIMNITFILLNPKVKADSLKTWRKTGNNIKVHRKQGEHKTGILTDTQSLACWNK